MKLDEKILNEIARYNSINKYIMEQDVPPPPADPLADPAAAPPADPLADPAAAGAPVDPAAAGSANGSAGGGGASCSMM